MQESKKHKQTWKIFLHRLKLIYDGCGLFFGFGVPIRANPCMRDLKLKNIRHKPKQKKQVGYKRKQIKQVTFSRVNERRKIITTQTKSDSYLRIDGFDFIQGLIPQFLGDESQHFDFFRNLRVANSKESSNSEEGEKDTEINRPLISLAWH